MMRTDTSKPDGQAQALHSKISNMPLQRGDVVRLVTSGGDSLGSRAAAFLTAAEHGYSVE